MPTQSVALLMQSPPSPEMSASALKPRFLASTGRKAVNRRTHELAALAGRVAPHVCQSDYEQAKRDISGESDGARQDAVLDALVGAPPRKVN